MNDYIFKKAQERAYKSASEINSKKPMPTPSSLPEIKVKRLEERELEKIAPSTGYPELDRLIKGFVPGHLYTLTGVENIGKSSLACNFAVRVAFQRRRVLYIALEPENTVIEYIASVYHDKRFDELTNEDLDLDELPIEVLGKESVDSTERMVQIIETLDRYDLVIIDHVGYFITSQNNSIQQQSNTIKQLVGIAKKKQCAIMIIAHLRKRGKNERKNYTPTSDDISGSAAFKQDSTEVMIVTRDVRIDSPDDQIIYDDFGKLYVTKTKTGPNGNMKLYFGERKANIISSEDMMNKSKPIEAKIVTQSSLLTNN